MSISEDIDIVIAGAGPTGLMAALTAAGKGLHVLVLESGPRAGRKLLATGSGRCNVTHDGSIDDLLAGFDKKRARFIKPALYAWTPEDTVRFFRDRGVSTVVERGGRIFPESGTSRDILDALLSAVREVGVSISYNRPLKAIRPDGKGFTVLTGAGNVYCQAVVVATGGLSMQRTGSTGDGYRFARECGHTVVTPHPSLVPLYTRETWPARLDGLTLKNIRLTIRAGKTSVARFGEMLFTGSGIGGPIVLEISREITDILHESQRELNGEIDLKPALDHKKLDARILREIESSPRRQFITVMNKLLPRDLATVIGDEFGFDVTQPSHQMNREERRRFLNLLKALPLTITGTASVEDALVTRGGVNLPEIDAHTMQSRILPGLFFAGEIMDVDGDCGGYNLQMCWSTGVLAGLGAADYCAGQEKK